MGWRRRAGTTGALRQIRDLPSAGFRVVLELEVRRVDCRRCGSVKRERLDFLANNAHFTKRFAYYVGRRCQQASIRDVARDLKLDWDSVKTLEQQYMRAQLRDVPARPPRKRSASTRSRSAKATATASWSATSFASGRICSAARIAPRPAWRRSITGWGARRAAKSGSP